MVCGSRKSSRLCASATTMAELSVGLKYMLYGSSTLTGVPGLPVFGIDRRQRAVGAALRVVGHPQCLKVPRRNDVLRIDADLETVDDLMVAGSITKTLVRPDVGNVDARERACDCGAQVPGGGFAVEVGRINHRRHAANRRHRARCGRRRLRKRRARDAESDGTSQRFDMRVSLH